MGLEESYEILGISNNASMDEIKQAYRQMVLKWHPDRHIDVNRKADVVNTFAKVNDAYRSLVHDRGLTSTAPASKKLPVLPTPVPSPKSSAESLTSISPFGPLMSNQPSIDSRTTPSSIEGSVMVKTLNQDHNSLLPLRRHDIPVDPQIRSRTMDDPVTKRRSVSQNYFPRQAPLRFLDRKVPGLSCHEGYNKNGQKKRVSPPLPTLARGDSYLLKPGPPLQSLGVGASKEWVYSFTLTLEEIFSGKHCHFCIVRHLLSGRSKNVVIEVDVPPGCQEGTRILCRGVGHELPNGRLQDVAFVIEVAPHDRFSRLQNDLFLDIRLPWTEALRRQPKKVCFRGIDGEEISIYIEYSREKALRGSLSIRGAGMPAKEMFRRGNLIVNWEIQPPQSRIRHILDRFLYLRTR